MHFANEYEIEQWLQSYQTSETPNLARGARTLYELMNWTNRNSDGWPYWSKPVKAADKLITLLEDADRAGRAAWSTPKDATDAQLKAALTPIKSFLTRQGVDHTTILAI